MPQNLSVEFDNSVEPLLVNITWQPPGNSREFDLDEYTVNITSTSGTSNSTQVPAGTTELQLTTDRTQRATFTVTITATNMCGQTGDAASVVLEYDPCKTCSSMSYYMFIAVIVKLHAVRAPCSYTVEDHVHGNVENSRTFALVLLLFGCLVYHIIGQYILKIPFRNLYNRFGSYLVLHKIS